MTTAEKMVLIADKKQRNMQIGKKKRVAINKLVELDKQCGQDILLYIFDREKQKMIEFRSTNEFDGHLVSRLLDDDHKWQISHQTVNSEQMLRGMDKNIKDIDDDESVEEQKTETVLNSPAKFLDLDQLMKKYLIPEF